MIEQTLEYQAQVHWLAEAGALFAQRGWASGGAGPLSARLNARQVVISAARQPKRQLHPASFVVVDLDGNVVTPGRTPAAETFLHIIMYRRNPELGAVLHSLSPPAVVLSRLFPDYLTFADYEYPKPWVAGAQNLIPNTPDLKSNAPNQIPDNPSQIPNAPDPISNAPSQIPHTSDPISNTQMPALTLPVLAYHPDIRQLAAQVDALLEHNPQTSSFLVAGRGLYTLGSSVVAAQEHAEALEFLLASEALAQQVAPDFSIQLTR